MYTVVTVHLNDIIVVNGYGYKSVYLRCEGTDCRYRYTSNDLQDYDILLHLYPDFTSIRHVRLSCYNEFTSARCVYKPSVELQKSLET